MGRTARLAWQCSSGLLLLLAAVPAGAQSNNVRVTQLSDVNFGTIANFNTDALRTQSVCVFAHTATGGYNVRADGTGPGGAFILSSGSASMQYRVQWSSSSGQSSGSSLTPGVPLSGQISAATHQLCSNGPPTSASLIVVLPAESLSSAVAGAYSGTLTIVVGPE